MISPALELFVNAAIDDGRIESGDVRRLQHEILPHGIASRDEADVLIALDRVVADKARAWDAFLTRSLVAFVLGAAGPGRAINRDIACWLVNSLSCGAGPTETAVAIAFEVVRESDLCDEALVAFVMRSPRGRSLAARAQGRAKVAA